MGGSGVKGGKLNLSSEPLPTAKSIRGLQEKTKEITSRARGVARAWGLNAVQARISATVAAGSFSLSSSESRDCEVLVVVLERGEPYVLVLVLDSFVFRAREQGTRRFAFSLDHTSIPPVAELAGFVNPLLRSRQ